MTERPGRTKDAQEAKRCHIRTGYNIYDNHPCCGSLGRNHRRGCTGEQGKTMLLVCGKCGNEFYGQPNAGVCPTCGTMM